MNKAGVLFLLVFFIGCGANHNFLDTTLLQAIPSEGLGAKSFTLSQDVVLETNGHPSIDAEGFLAGRYTAEFSDNDGVFYRGPKNAHFTVFDGIRKTTCTDCGIWISNSNKNDVRFYGYVSRAESDESAGVVVAAIIASDYGKINLPDMPMSKEFVDLLYASMVR